MERGKLIYYEGGEGTGKSSHIKYTKKYLQNKGIPFKIVREPGGTILAEKIRDILLNKESQNMNSWTEILLFQASRSELYSEIVIPTLEEGISVGQDRSGDSTLAYQGYGRGKNLRLLTLLNKESRFGCEPDLAFIIDIDPVKGLEKELNQDRMSLAGLEFHQKVRQGYLEIAKNNPKNYVVIPYIENGLEEMQSLMRPHIDKLFKF